jgi:putative phosphoribosyl transferase
VRHDRIDPANPGGLERPAVPVWRRAQTFRDRTEAGRLLASELEPLVSGPAVVAAIPRGGVPVAVPIVERLATPLTVAYARKLTAPLAPELAFGAIDEDGHAIVDATTASLLGLAPGEVEAAKKRVAAEIERRMKLYRVPPLGRYLPGATVVLVDDGLATGLTMRAAVAYARRHGAREVIVAVPCASARAVDEFGRQADRLVALIVDEAVLAVGAYYVDFSPVSDQAVLAILERLGAAERLPATG